ncbi:hypothetical protein RvY_09356 [Ramazzottius varieornatus]|uniref:UDENN domain-containing protein n=1 Tax=Ramazzottius varieornatus TaxID=947166 RepID=A0A1D1V936_RAMVA|nr:hypothetical protein RvY_09356 [Ramazzottius varieornatus]
MGSRIRSHPDRLFKLFAQVVAPENDIEAWILQKFPDEFDEQDSLKNVPVFCFPTLNSSYGTVRHFCFVLTDIEGKFTFGFCRFSGDGKTCLCILSYFPWHDLFYKMLNYIVDLMTKNPSDDLLGFLQAAYRYPVPRGGEELHVIHKFQKVEFREWVPDAKRLPSIPENRVITEYFNALDVNNMTTVFASLLNERRIIFTSKKLGKLTGCVMAANVLLYPMQWQHIFVPVLPKKLIDYVTAPMPFMIGIPDDMMPAVRGMDLGEVVIVDVDQNTVQTPFDDVRALPSNVVGTIKSGAGKMFGDGVARTFMRALVVLIGGYRFGLSLTPGQKISFSMEKFIRSRPPYLQEVLAQLTEQQIFRQFIEERLALLNEGEGFSDEFEQEVSLLIDHESGTSKDVSVADQYYRWRSKGEFFLRNVTNKVKDRGKEAVKGIRTKIGSSDLGSTRDRVGGSEPEIFRASSPVPRRIHSVMLPGKSMKDSNKSLSRQPTLDRRPSDAIEMKIDPSPLQTSHSQVEPRPSIAPQKTSPDSPALISFEEPPLDTNDSMLEFEPTVTENPSRQEFARALNSLYAARPAGVGVPWAAGTVNTMQPQWRSPYFTSQPLRPSLSSPADWGVRSRQVLPLAAARPPGISAATSIFDTSSAETASKSGLGPAHLGSAYEKGHVWESFEP